MQAQTRLQFSTLPTACSATHCQASRWLCHQRSSHAGPATFAAELLGVERKQPLLQQTVQDKSWPHQKVQPNFEGKQAGQAQM